MSYEYIKLGNDTFYYDSYHLFFGESNDELIKKIIPKLTSVSSHIMYLARTESDLTKTLKKHIVSTYQTHKWPGTTTNGLETLFLVKLNDEIKSKLNNLTRDDFIGFEQTYLIEDISFIMDDQILSFMTSHEDLWDVASHIINED